MPSALFFVGSETEVAHHAAPLRGKLPFQIVSPHDVVAVAQPGDLAVFFSEHFDRFRDACQRLKQNNVATLYLLDGIIEWRNAWENRCDEPACPYTMRPVLAHKAACIGLAQARVLDSWGNVGKTEIVGVPRFDSLCKTMREPAKGEVFRLLVMTAKTPGFTPAQVAKCEQSLQDVKLWLEQCNYRFNDREIQVVWRLTGGMDATLNVENELTDLSGRELSDSLTHVDAVISTPSTAMLEAMLMGLPVASLDYHECPAYLAPAWAIRQADSIEGVMRELMNPPASKMHFQQTELADALYISGASEENRYDSKLPFANIGATDRLVSLITEMQRMAAEHLQKNEPISFPPQILQTVAGLANPEFDHRKIYPSATEFAQAEMAELQVELSHSRREIQHLHREMAQLQSELDLAHSIFDQIQRHPVAGPIVRLRQKFLDWFARNESRESRVESTEY